MENAEQAKQYIEKASKVLPEDDHNHEPIAKFLNSYKTAAEMADNDEKKAILSDVANKLAHQLTFILFDQELLTEELEAEYRKLPKTSESAKAVEEANATRKEGYEKLAKLNTEAQNAQKEIDIFQQVIGGLSKEEAEKRYAEYEAAAGQGRV